MDFYVSEVLAEWSCLLCNMADPPNRISLGSDVYTILVSKYERAR